MVTTYQAHKILNYNFGGTTYAVPSFYYIGLSTGNINPDGTGVKEPIDSAYRRMMISNNKTIFSVAEGGVVTVKIDIVFPAATTEWGKVKDVFIADSVTGGNILYYDTLKLQRIIEADYEIFFPANSIKFQMVML